ncbi:MFS transporter [Paenibacillus sp. GCM10027629]|uniref:MFS transporter n=1 Tax=Paenibacillus sp. GCM10027629 TaxID=3273414 RepID=UPI00362B5B3E
MKRNLTWSLIIFAIGVFMGALDNGIITAALTTLNRSFGVSPTWGAWTITVYTLGLAISVPIIGKLSDRYGRKKLFIFEVTLFGLGSLLVALSPNFTWFLVCRFIQAIGGGGIFIIASSFVLNTFPREKQGRMLGILGGMNGIASVLGPNIGSFILNMTGSWHWLFLINVPIAITLAILGMKFIHEEQKLTEARLDYAGVAILSLAVLSMMYGLTKLDGVNLVDSLTSGPFLGFIAIGLVLLVILVITERRVEKSSKDPILPIFLFKNGVFCWTLFYAMLSGTIIASIIFVPGFIEQYLGVSSAVSGYWFTPLALAAGAGAALGGRLVDRKGSVFTMLTASAIAALGFLLFAVWVEQIWQMVIASCLVGIGFGSMLGAPVNILATENAGDNKGVALATTSLSRQIGLTLAPTLFAGFLARSFMHMGDAIKSHLGEAHIQGGAGALPNMPTQTDFSTMQAGIAQIPDPTTKKALMDALHEVVGIGYHGLFYAAMTICIVLFATTLVIGVVRKNKQGRHPLHQNL